MCPACMAAAAVTAAKVASLGGLTAYGVRTLLFKPLPHSESPSESIEPRRKVEAGGAPADDPGGR
jgi:hypothetical protein